MADPNRARVEAAARSRCHALNIDPDEMIIPGITMPQGYTKPVGPARPQWTFHTAAADTVAPQPSQDAARVAELEAEVERHLADKHILREMEMDARDELAKSQEQVKALREALEPFSVMADTYNLAYSDGHQAFVSVGSLRRARDTLATLDADGGRDGK